MNILKNTRRWRFTHKGLSANLYAKIRERTRNRTKEDIQFTLAQFRTWLYATFFEELYRQWRESGYDPKQRPSVDRIDCIDGYRFENMQVIAANENRLKGDREKLILWGKKVYQSTLEGNDIAVYQSIKEAHKKTGINKNNISSACSGKRNQAGGYRWRF